MFSASLLVTSSCEQSLTEKSCHYQPVTLLICSFMELWVLFWVGVSVIYFFIIWTFMWLTRRESSLFGMGACHFMAVFWVSLPPFCSIPSRIKFRSSY